MGDMMSEATYGFRINWKTFDGESCCVKSSGHKSIDHAKAYCIASAEMAGWTPPKWWQWWRRGDTRL